jgi:hypothetical protein
MTEKDAIAKAVQHYIDGAKSGSSAKMRRARALDSRLAHRRASQRTGDARIVDPSPYHPCPPTLGVFFVWSGRSGSCLARQRRVRGATPTRLPESRPRRLASVAISVPQSQPSTRAAKTRTPPAHKRKQTVRRAAPLRNSKRKWTGSGRNAYRIQRLCMRFFRYEATMRSTSQLTAHHSCYGLITSETLIPQN